MSRQLDALGFVPGKGIPYNYGIWKAKKGKFRFIAGARADPSQPSANPGDQRGGPPRVPTYFMCKALVKVLDHVGSSLKVIDEKRQQETGLRCYWPIKSANEFTQLARSHAKEIALQGMATYDFSTMFTSFSQDTICLNVMEAFKEAQAFEATRCPTRDEAP